MNRLKELRQEKGLSQKELAKDIGVHYRTLQNWENGKAEIKPDKAQVLADFFGVSVGYLLGYEDMTQQVIIENEFLRDENRRLNNEMIEHYFAITAKANLLDIIIAEGYILQSTLDKCINQLDEIDQMEIRKEMTNDKE